MSNKRGPHLLALGMVAGMVMIVSLLFYFWFFETNPLVYRNIPFPPTLTQINPGGVIPLVVERCNTTNRVITYESTHSVKNVATGNMLVMPNVTVAIPPGCSVDMSLVNKIPIETPPGQYHILGIATVNGTLRDFKIPWSSQSFLVGPLEPIKPIETPVVTVTIKNK